jgi:hypothetical protein
MWENRPVAVFPRCAASVLLSALLALGAVLALTAARASAATTTVNFESLTGPIGFCPAPASLLVIGNASFSGGGIMTHVIGLPSNTSTVYGTSVCPRLAPTLTITFAKPVNNVSAQVMNGFTGSYTVASPHGASVTKAIPFCGAETISLPENGITSVTSSQAIPTPFWDFFIDNVSFTVPPEQTGMCQQAWAKLASLPPDQQQALRDKLEGDLPALSFRRELRHGVGRPRVARHARRGTTRPDRRARGRRSLVICAPLR